MMKYIKEYHSFGQEEYSSPVKRHSKSFIRLALQLQMYCTQMFRASWTVGYRKNDQSPEMQRLYEMVPDQDRSKKFITANVRTSDSKKIAMLSLYVDLEGTKFQFKHLKPNTAVYVYAYETQQDVRLHKFIIMGDFTWLQCLQCMRGSKTIEGLYEKLQEESKKNNSKV